MLEFLRSFSEGLTGNIVGGVGTQSVVMATLFLIVILVVLLLAARLELEVALMIVSPGILVASFAGLLPPLTFGVIVLCLALFWSGVIMAVVK